MTETSPDVVPLVDLTLLDLDAQALVDQAITDAETKLPDWTPREGNTEVVVLEGQALITAELIYAVNRLPDAILESLLAVGFSLERDPGVAPSATVRFTSSAPGSITVPAGTRVRVPYGVDDALDLLTDVDLILTGGTGTVAATAEEPTTLANGTPVTADVDLVDAIAAIDTVALTTPVAGGVDPEDSAAYIARGGLLLRRLVSTLVLPEHFTIAALEDPSVVRAITVDLYNPDNTIPAPATPTATPSTTGGTLTAGVKSYRVSAVNAAGETLASTAVTATTSGTTGSVALTWTAPTVPAGVGAITGYRVYGRTGGTEGLLASPTGTSYTDTGAATPAGTVPTVNTTAPLPGSAPGYVTVAVAGPGGTTLPTATTDALRNRLESKALAALTVKTIAPTITTVPVTVTVTKTPGAVTADVQAAVTAAVTGYLNPDTWVYGGTVYRNELIALIDRVTGVDRVVTLTAPAADVTLTGVAPLVKAGAVTVAVS